MLQALQRMKILGVRGVPRIHPKKHLRVGANTPPTILNIKRICIGGLHRRFVTIREGRRGSARARDGLSKGRMGLSTWGTRQSAPGPRELARGTRFA